MFSDCLQMITCSKAKATYVITIIHAINTYFPPTLNSFTPQRQELESENKKLKHNLVEMRQSLLGNAGASSGAPGSPAYKVLLEQLNSACEELDVRKEEVLILRSQLVSQKEAMHHKVEENVLTGIFWTLWSHGAVVLSQNEAGCKWMAPCLLASTFLHLCVVFHPCCFSVCLFVCTISLKNDKGIGPKSLLAKDQFHHILAEILISAFIKEILVFFMDN